MPEIRRLRADEIRTLRYFHEEKGDLTRWVEWYDLQPILERWHPELVKAVRDLQIAERVLDAVVANLKEEEE